MLRLENREGIFTQRIPTPEQVAEAAEKVVEVGVDGVAFADVHATEVSRFTPHCKLSVRCRNGQAQLLVTAYPA
jgi:hypothetical protein